jgi:amino acid transporter
MLFSGARSVAALAEDHVVFRSLKTWSRRGGVPARAVWLLTAIALIQVATIGTEAGRSILDRVVQILGFESIPWDRFHGGFETLVAASAPTFWGLMLGTAAAFFQLRRTGQSPREFACPGAPLLPLIFAATCGFMLWNSIGYAGAIGLLGLVPCAVAAVAAQFSGRRRA